MHKIKLDESNQDEYIQMYKDYIKELQAYDSEITDASDSDALNRKHPSCEIYLFEECGEIVGFAILGMGLPNSFCGHDVFIEEFYVKKNLRRRGRGRDMMRVILDTYPSMDFSAFIIKDNLPAFAFWDNVFESFDYSERTSAGNIRALGDNTVFKYWTPYLPF